MTNYNLNQVLPLGVLTGSRAFNCATEESDWDIVILESNLPDYTGCEYTETDFINDEYDENPSKGKPGFNVSKHIEFEDEKFIEYDQLTIWGPLQRIVKYWDDNEVCINLFVYQDKHAIILDKFIELNNLMNFVHNTKLKDRTYRIKEFTKVIKHVGITDT